MRRVAGSPRDSRRRGPEDLPGCRLGGGGSRRSPGSRSKSAFIATSVSMRARCMPEAHVRTRGRSRCGAALGRKMSNVSGVVPAGLVVVGRAEVARSRVAPPGSCTPPTSMSRVRRAHDDQQRRLPADALLDGLGQQRPVGPHGVELVRVGEQAVEQVGGGPVGRLGPGRQQQPAGRRRSPRRSSCWPSCSALAQHARSCRRPGRPRRSATMPEKYSRSSAEARRARSQSTLTPMSSTARRWNSGRSSSGSPSSAAITRDREREQQLAHEIGARRRRRTRRSCGSPAARPARSPTAAIALAGEGLLQDRPVGVVLGLVHLEDRAAHDRPITSP